MPPSGCLFPKPAGVLRIALRIDGVKCTQKYFVLRFCFIEPPFGQGHGQTARQITKSEVPVLAADVDRDRFGFLRHHDGLGRADVDFIRRVQALDRILRRSAPKLAYRTYFTSIAVLSARSFPSARESPTCWPDPIVAWLRPGCVPTILFGRLSNVRRNVAAWAESTGFGGWRLGLNGISSESSREDV